MSDHFSGPRAIAGPAGDICDVYAFPSPQSPARLVLVINVSPLASASTRFSDAIVYRFRLRPITIATTGPAAAFTVDTDEIVFDVSFDAPSLDNGAVARQLGRCTGSTGSTVELTVNDERGGCHDGLRAFAGLRSDPFFIDLPALQETLTSGRVAFKEVGQNSLAGCNVLSIVVEVECATLVEPAEAAGAAGPGGGSLFAVAGETVTAGKLPIRIERVGRPEIKNVIMSSKEYDTVNRDLEIRDLYNLEDAFHMGKDYRNAYRARLNANLAVFDRIGGGIDWPSPNGGGHPLTELLLNDYLVIDITKPFSGDGFLEIERAMLAGRAHTTCGGRSLNDDVMDTWYGLLINGLDAPAVRDGVDGPTVPATGAFPYLAPPNPEPTKGMGS